MDNKMLKTLALALAVAALAGCAHYSHPTKTKADFDADTYECEKDAAAIQDNLRSLVMQERCMKLKGWSLK